MRGKTRVSVKHYTNGNIFDCAERVLMYNNKGVGEGARRKWSFWCSCYMGGGTGLRVVEPYSK